jgi:hypothetical protein
MGGTRARVGVEGRRWVDVVGTGKGRRKDRAVKRRQMMAGIGEGVHGGSKGEEMAQ